MRSALTPADPELAPSVAPAQVQDVIVWGKIVGVFGTAGEVRVHVHNRTSTLFNREREATLRSPDGSTKTAVLKVRPGPGGRVIGRINGLRDRTQALTWIGIDIEIEASALPALEPDEFYVRDVVGKPVRVGDLIVGHLVDVHDSGPVTLLEIRSGGDTEFIPCTAESVVSIDATGVVLTTWNAE